MSNVQINDNLICICGESASGKSQSLSGLRNPEGVMYLNTEAGKKLPFKNSFKTFNITDPFQVYEGFDEAEKMPEIHTIVIDSSTYLMDMFESIYVRPATDGRKAWGEFAHFWKDLLQIKVARSTKNVIVTAHTLSELNEQTHTMEVKIPVKGQLKNNGIESYFSCVIATKKSTVKALETYKSDLLSINEEEDEIGLKYVYQTRLTKQTVGERIRSPIELFSKDETFINNDIQAVLDRLHNYYSTTVV